MKSLRNYFITITVLFGLFWAVLALLEWPGWIDTNDGTGAVFTFFLVAVVCWIATDAIYKIQKDNHRIRIAADLLPIYLEHNTDRITTEVDRDGKKGERCDLEIHVELAVMQSVHTAELLLNDSWQRSDS